jgi:hypothetical protein
MTVALTDAKKEKHDDDPVPEKTPENADTQNTASQAKTNAAENNSSLDDKKKVLRVFSMTAV